MKFPRFIATMLLALVASTTRATVDLTLYNTVPLLDSDGVTPLQGTATSGDLAQLILVGPNGVIDPPDSFGNPGGDDVLLIATHVGAGLPTTNTGLLVKSNILYPDSHAGTNAYVRFWNASTAAASTHYGTSAVFALPPGDAFGLAELDFVPSSGYPHIANIPFGTLSAIPEPSSLFAFGSVIILGWTLRRRRLTTAAAALLAAVTLLPARAEIPAPLDATANVSILDINGQPLSGNNPVTGDSTPRCLVHIIQVGPNGVPDWPNPDGSPGGDDILYRTTVIGQGIDPNLNDTGRFSTSFYPPPTGRFYARVFDGPTLDTAQHFGQSATFLRTNVEVFDVSALGLRTVWHRIGSLPGEDDDGDGQTNLQELIANTNPLNHADALLLRDFLNESQLTIDARPGRRYILERTTDDLTGPVTWTPIVELGPLPSAQNITLADPNPPTTPKAFYRIRVVLP